MKEMTRRLVKNPPSSGNEYIFNTTYGNIAITGESLRDAEHRVRQLCDELENFREEIDALMSQYGARFSSTEQQSVDQTSAKDFN